jgi:hypothetical protein
MAWRRASLNASLLVVHLMMLGGVERSLQLIGVVIDEVAAVQVHELGRADKTGEDETEYLLLSLGLGLGLDHQLLL